MPRPLVTSGLFRAAAARIIFIINDRTASRAECALCSCGDGARQRIRTEGGEAWPDRAGPNPHIDMRIVKNTFADAAMTNSELGGAASAAALDAAHAAGARWIPQADGKEAGGLSSRRKSLSELMGPSRHVGRIVEQVAQVAGSPLTVLIQGETGTGKELVAHAIHSASCRRLGPFIALDCGAIPDSLLESELFGYERGAFTGADQPKTGYIRLAHGGSLLLDELVNLPFTTQAKLLRALQERLVHPLGGRRPIPVDVRVIATSNISLEDETRAGRFRQDLYYRINEFTITLPPLRERAEDIVYLADRFLAEARREFGRRILGISDDAAQLLLRCPWPGNVRQLRSIIRRAALLTADVIEPEHLVGLCTESFVASAVTDSDGPPAGHSLKAIAAAAAADAERRTISEALRAMKGNKSAVARWLEIDYKTLLFKLKRYGLCGSKTE